MKNELYQRKGSQDFYEDRYERGYMEDWPDDKKNRVFELIKNLSLPKIGFALDFGCGNGVFTDLLRQALPNWKIFGCDISSKAINQATIRYSDCTFFLSNYDQPFDLKFDFVFSHHVLEHVYNIDQTLIEINSYLKPEASIFHIFPCGNEGSLEHNVCMRRIGGIQAGMEGRFFFEDEGHVRRLSTEQMNVLMINQGFVLNQSYYSNQYYGAIKWISQSSIEFISDFANPLKAIDQKAFRFLFFLRFRLKLLFLLQQPSIQFKSLRLLQSRKMKYYKMAVSFLPFCLSSIVLFVVNYQAKMEWHKNKHFKNGSEMYLFYSRN